MCLGYLEAVLNIEKGIVSMIYPNVSVEEWCKRYKITVKTRPCTKCGKLQTTSIPWASQGWRGLVAPLHDCGIGYELSTAVAADKKERNEWKLLFSDFSQDSGA